MADEQQTDVTNLASETPTETAVATATNTSTTEATTPPSDSPPSEGEADPLAAVGDGLAADPPAADGEEGDAGEPAGEGTQAAVELHGAPEGDYELELPEGMALDTAALEEIAPLAKELNLSNAGLSKLALEALPVAEKMISNRMVEQVVAQRRAWETDARALVQGGKLTDGTAVEASAVFAGENMDSVMQSGARAIDRFTTDASGQPLLFPAAKVDPETGEASPGTFRDFLRTTGLGNHPAMIQFAFMAGKAVGEDSDFERHGSTPQTKLTREEKYFPHRTTTT